MLHSSPISPTAAQPVLTLVHKDLDGNALLGASRLFLSGDTAASAADAIRGMISLRHAARRYGREYHRA